MMSSSADKSIIVTPIDVDTEMQTMTGHDSPIWDVKFNSTGSRVVTVADNGSIQTYIRQEMFYVCLLIQTRTFFFIVVLNPNGKHMLPFIQMLQCVRCYCKHILYV